MVRLLQEEQRRPSGTRLTGQIYGLRGKLFKEGGMMPEAFQRSLRQHWCNFVDTTESYG